MKNKNLLVLSEFELPDSAVHSLVSLTGACFRVAVYNEQPEQDSLNDPNSGPEPASTPAELKPPGKHRHHSRPKLRSGRALLGILASGRSSAVDMLEHTEPL